MRTSAKKTKKVSRKTKVSGKKIRKEISGKVFHFGKMSLRQGLVAILFFCFVFLSGVLAARGSYYKELIKMIPQSKTLEEARKENMEKKITEMVKGTPMEVMAPYIAEKDPKTAAFLVGIAKKESNWGKRRPVLNGDDCYNYWGYRGVRDTMGSGGHTCFDSPKEAVDVVARRIKQIIKKNKVESAKNMIVWKCGYSCAAHSPESVSKWIKDVDMYAGKILN